MVPAINQVLGRPLGWRGVRRHSLPALGSPRRVRPHRSRSGGPARSARAVVQRTELRELVGRFQISFPVEVRIAPADDVWLSAALRPRHRLGRGPHTGTRSPTPTTSEKMRSELPGRRRATSHCGSCTPATPPGARQSCPPPRGSLLGATGSTPHACSATTNFPLRPLVTDPTAPVDGQ